ncbi:hypothetical protein OHA69_41375 [Streptomyces anulatus]|uniref:hypothetical protein n=1 Tax=Streptomyces anulatus TaxID=1892 RepID=UPI0022547606|nr:hypothetical protein [Streptomyces anulatus]MCX4524045.1 hypothetical protein [Streptomyces anulatus]
MNPNSTSPARWDPPDPKQLPELRSALLDHYSSAMAMVWMRTALRAGRCAIIPEVPGLNAAPDEVAAQILVGSERLRLAEAQLFYATADMTALALAAAASPPREKVSLDRPPAESGLIVFEEPIGGYVEDIGATLAVTSGAGPGEEAKVTKPIVAVSWSQWTPDAIEVDQGTVRWSWKRPGHGVTTIPRVYRGLWLTFYTPSGSFSRLAPDTVVGTTPEGTPLTAGQVTRLTGQVSAPALSWDNEVLLAEGVPFAEARPDTTDAWTHVLYTAWQLMAEGGRTRWTETEEIPRPRAGAKRDARQGVTAPATVHVVNVHTTRRPPRQRAAEDAAASTGRREPQWSCRWPVSPHRRDHCMNPARHAEGDCRHEDRLIPGYVKGPEDKPLRISDTVHLWDRQPDQQ